MRLGITGHREIPPSGVDAIRDALQALVQHHGRVVGVSSLAKGADQLFARCVLSCGKSLEAIIPCREYASTFDEADRDSYFELLRQAANVEILDYELPSEDAFLAAGQRLVHDVDLLVAVWDGRAAEGKGGTADVVRYAQSINVPVAVVWPEDLDAHATA